MHDLRDNLDAVPSRLARCESRTVSCHNVCSELRTLIEPWLASFDAEVERVFEDRLSEALSSRVSAFLDDEGVNFVEFVNALEDEAAKRIFARLEVTQDDLASSLPTSLALIQSPPSAAAASSSATSAEFTWVGDEVGHEAFASHIPADTVSFQAGTDLAWSPPTPGGFTGGATKWLSRRSGPRQRRAAAALVEDGDSTPVDQEAELNASYIADPDSVERS